MTIKNNKQAMRAMTLAFKLANKSIGKTRHRRLQCLATAKRLIKAAEDFTQTQAPAMKDKKAIRRNSPDTKRTNKKPAP